MKCLIAKKHLKGLFKNSKPVKLKQKKQKNKSNKIMEYFGKNKLNGKETE